MERISLEERNFTGLDYFLLWGGAAISLAEILAGGILAPLGVATGLVVIVVGHIIGNTPLALGGIIGAREGVPTMMSTRPAFGVKGSYLAAFLNIMQLIGWTAIMLIICGEAANTIMKEVLGVSNLSALILISGIVTTLWALVGHRSWKWLQRISVTALLVLCAVMTYAVFREGIPQAPVTGDLSVAGGIDLVIAMPISWLPLVSDYSRYASNSKTAFAGTWIGYFVVSSWMYLLGLGATVFTGVADPIPMMLALGLGIPALLIVFFSTFTTTFLDVYSTAISALNIFEGLGERRGVIMGGVLGTALALVFPMVRYEHFLLLIGSMFCPLFAVVLTDYFIIKGSYKEDKMFVETPVNWAAVAAWVTGAAVYHALTTSTLGCFGSSVPSMIVASWSYVIFMKVRTWH